MSSGPTRMCEILVELGGVNVLDVDDAGNDVVVSVETQVREIGDETIFQATGGVTACCARREGVLGSLVRFAGPPGQE